MLDSASKYDLCLRDIEMAAHSPTAAAGPDLGPFSDESDDLPRTFRREKEARAREARERAAQERAAAPSLPMGAQGPSASRPAIYADPDLEPVLGDMPFPAVVRRFDVPFFHLAGFFLKAVIAGIPALLLLGAILWLFGAALQALLPSLIKMKILISFPN